MSDVTLEVGGRKYTVACQDGQEDNVRRLAGMIDDKIGSLGANVSANEAKNLLFAALLLADELDEAKKRGAAAPAAATTATDSQRLATQLERMATALENAATTLEAAGSTS